MTEHQFTDDGLPLYPVDMPDVRYKADLAAIVTQVWMWSASNTISTARAAP
jgi:hypothetical protein